MAIFKNIAKSIYSPAYYQELLQKPFNYSFKYFALFALILSLVASVFFTAMFVPKAIYLVQNGMAKFMSDFPKDLEVSIKDGIASSTVPQPYFIKIPKSMKENVDPNSPVSKLENMIVIDTNNEFDAQKFVSYKTIMVLNKSTFTYINEKGLATQQLKEVGNVTFSKDNMLALIDKFMPYINIAYPAFWAITLAMSFVIIFMQMIYMFLGALVVWAVAKIKGMDIDYWKSYQMGLHLITLVLLVNFVFMASGVTLTIPFFGTMLLVLLAVINLKKPVTAGPQEIIQNNN